MSHRSDDTGRCRLGATEMGWLFAALMAAMPIARATTFTVTSAADTGGSTCGATCTLRQAINAANAAAGADTINFNISGGGVRTITPTSALPTISSPVTIDGYTQPGSVANTASVGTNALLKIELDGSGIAAGANGLQFGSTSSPSTVRGLIINGFRKTSSGTKGTGIDFVNLSNSGGFVRGCFIGTDATGTTAKGNAFGIIVDYDGVSIGGTALADRNLISGNSSRGVELFSQSNIVQGNLIGVAADGISLLGNGLDGVLLENGGNLIGGTGAGAGNRIAGNNANGILVVNGAAGVTIERNAIWANSALGIDLSASVGASSDGVTPNDVGDGDSGSNNLQNYPVITVASVGSGGFVINGTLNSTANHTFRIEYFVNDAIDPSGFGEGQRFLLSQNVMTGAAGNSGFSAGGLSGITSGQIITATATDTVTGDTSEFSSCTVAVTNTTVINTHDSGGGSLRQAILNANSNAGSDVIDFAIPGAGVHVIHLLSALPTITDAVTIDGYTQLGAAANTLTDGDDAAIRIQLDGSSLTGLTTSGLGVCASNSLIRGVAIVGFPGYAIAVGRQASGALCAAPPGAVAVEGDFVGLAADGTTGRANGNLGVLVAAAASTRIGGASAAQRNLISANSGHGIGVSGASTGTTIDGNYVGTDATGQIARGNAAFGVLLTVGSSGTVVGGTAPNLVAFNDEGIFVHDGSTGNTFTRNSIRGNFGLGIDLCVLPSCAQGVTPNDTDDTDSGGNNLQNFPVVTALARTATGLLISGSLDRPATASSLTFAIGVYANTACDLSGFGEGERYLGEFNFVSANSGVQTFTNVAFPTTVALPAGTKITLTATDPNGNTSEFSQCAELDAGAQTFVVNSTLDIDDENCTAAVDGCTLREAINAANARVGADFIAFNIPGSGVHVISPTSALPTIIDAVMIDGYTQPGASPNTLADGDNAKILVQVDGLSVSGNASGLSVCANDTTLRGLSLTHFNQQGIAVGATAGGVLCASPVVGVQVRGNFIGLAPDGSAAGNDTGVFVDKSVASIGGNTPAERNILSSSVNGGIFVINPSTAGTTILGNYIGTDPTGTLDRGNSTRGVAINVGAFGVTIGGAAPNRIAFNGTGIFVTSGSHPNTLFANDFFSNDVLAIDLSAGSGGDGPTANDADDGDSGGNNLQNFPVLTSAVQDGPNLHVVGSLDVPAGPVVNNYTLAFYANTSCSGRGQGELYLGYVNVELSGASQEFDVQLPATAPLGSRISSTATSAGGTSEFSTCVTLAAGDHIFANGFD